MLIEYLTKDPRAGDSRVQKQANRSDGTVPDETISEEGALAFLKHILREDQQDTLVINHPRVLGQAVAARKVLESLRSKKGAIKLPDTKAFAISSKDEVETFMYIHKISLWGTGTPNQHYASREFHSLKQQLNDEQMKIIRHGWLAPECSKSSNRSDRKAVLNAVSKLAERKVQDWEVELLCNPEETFSQEFIV
ncbi:hypothetical protein ROA7450_03835 [Roseovarius albus]|uniref:Uncharacterized protein n=1 Tax=Roseovarius albus TaxID=1247867 RepID=A0A1X7A4A2_9RHOB|nr:hypothetical protein [Roseovarius albus]SLN70283.1 hypothetical protein ROA7450_03835 [Roseovarius albus]